MSLKVSSTAAARASDLTRNGTSRMDAGVHAIGFCSGAMQIGRTIRPAVRLTPPPKMCSECKVVKPLAAFYRHPRGADGHENRCKVCKRAYEAERRVLKAETITTYRAEYERRPERIAARDARFRAFIHTPKGRESRRITQRIYRSHKRASTSLSC